MIGAAPAGIGHPTIDVGVGRVRAPLQQRERAHNHSGLAVAALRRIELLPGDLDRMVAIRRDPFDRGDFFAGRHARRNAAGSDRLTIDVHRAGAALPDAAAELGSRQADVIADHPQQWRYRVGIDGMSRSVHVQIELHRDGSFARSHDNARGADVDRSSFLVRVGPHPHALVTTLRGSLRSLPRGVYFAAAFFAT